MKFFKGIKSLFVLLMASSLLFSCTEETVTPQTTLEEDPETPVVAADAPAFTLSSLAGSEVSLSDFDGKVVVLFFFGNSCPTCKAVAPSIESELATPYANNENYQILGLDQWDGNAASVEAFKSSTKVTFPLLLKAASVASAYKTTYDRIIVIDKDGKVAFDGKQNGSADLKAAKTKVDELL